MPQTTIYALVMFAAGVGIPILAALNAALGRHVGGPAAATVVLFCIAAMAAVAVTLITRQQGALAAIPGAPKHLLLAGLLVAFYVLSITFIAPKFGVGNAIFFVLLGQLVSAALIDHFGLFGARLSPFTPMRGLGIALMAAGVFVTVKV